MEDINFIKNIDNLGRIVIPMDIRRKLSINTGDVLSIRCFDNTISLCKFSSLEDNRICEILNCFVDAFDIKYILLDREKVVFSNLVMKSTKIDGNLQLLVKDGNTYNSSFQSYLFGESKIDGLYNQVPIVTNEGLIGSLIVLDNDDYKCYGICQLIAKLIMLELNIS